MVESLNVRSKLRPVLEALAMVAAAGGAFSPSLRHYVLQMRGHPEWPPYAGASLLALIVLLWRLVRSESAGDKQGRPAVILLIALGLLGFALACSAAWLAWFAAVIAIASVIDHVGGTDLIAATWQLLVLLALGALLPFWFFQPIFDQFQLLLLPVGQRLLESCGIVCVIDGDVLELYRARLDPAQAYFGMPAWAGVLAGSLLWANLRARGPMHTMLSSIAGLGWLWVVSAAQILVFGLILENRLPLASEQATLLPLTAAAAAVLTVLIISTDEALAPFGRLFAHIAARFDTAPMPETVVLAPANRGIATCERSPIATLLWRGLLLCALAIGFEQLFYDGQYWTSVAHDPTSVALARLRQSLLPPNWEDWHLISFAQRRAASCLGKAATVVTWQYQSPEESALVTLSRRMHHDAVAKGEADSDKPPTDTDASAGFPETKAVRDQAGKHILTFSSELAKTRAVAQDQPHDYFQAWRSEGLGQVASHLNGACSSASLCLSISIESYAGFSPNQEERARQFASAIVRKAQSADWAAEGAP